MTIMVYYIIHKYQECLRYSYDGYSFDSSIELCFYIWLVDNNIPFTYQPDDFFEYEYDGMIKHYCPDFKIGDMFFEIKGDHFFENKDPTKRMICPWDHKQDNLYEVKHQCMLKNDILIVTQKDYCIFVQYVVDTYGQNYWKQFKKSNNV